MRQCLILGILVTAIGCASAPTTTSSINAESDRLLTVDHYVRVRSTVPSMNGQMAQLYVRERVSGRVVTRGGSGVVLFVHGAGTPAEVAFDVPSGDFSWMGYLANAGFDVFSMDVTGYGRSTRPTVMNDPCNLARDQQSAFVPSLIPAPCAPTSECGDDDRLGLERHRRRDGLRARPPSRRSRQHGGLVARRSARRRLRRAAPRSGPEAGSAGARVQPHRRRESARPACRGRRLQHAIAPGVRGELGPSGRLSRISSIRRRATPCGRRCSHPIRSARRGGPACGARRRRRRGGGTRRWWGRPRRRR